MITMITMKIINGSDHGNYGNYDDNNNNNYYGNNNNNNDNWK